MSPKVVRMKGRCPAKASGLVAFKRQSVMLPRRQLLPRRTQDLSCADIPCFHLLRSMCQFSSSNPRHMQSSGLSVHVCALSDPRCGECSSFVNTIDASLQGRSVSAKNVDCIRRSIENEAHWKTGSILKWFDHFSPTTRWCAVMVIYDFSLCTIWRAVEC